MAEQDYVASGAFRADGVNYVRGQEVPLDSIHNAQILKDTGAVVLSNSDEGQAAIADYERLQSEESQRQMERDLEATLAPNSNPMQEHNEEELEAIRNLNKDEPFIPSQEGGVTADQVGETEEEDEAKQPFVPIQEGDVEYTEGDVDDRGDDPRAYPAQTVEGEQEMVDPGGAQPPENLSRSRFHQHAELGASSEELAEKDAEQEEAARLAAEEQGEQASSQEDARQNEGLADNEPTPEEREQGVRAGGGAGGGSNGDVEATDGAKKLAEEEDVDLSQVEGTGQGGKITKQDVENHLKD